jgi:hypothetical protein
MMLCDGGMKTSMEAHVRAELSKLRDDQRDITPCMSRISTTTILAASCSCSKMKPVAVFDLASAE